MNNTLRTFIRFTIIAIFLILLVFLSITLFKLIPKGINQLATASLSLTGIVDENEKTSTTTGNKINETVTGTSTGLNGVINKNDGNIIISESKNKNISPQTQKTIYKTVYYPISSNRPSGLKNIKVTLTSLGIIDRYTGQFIPTNSFNTNDVVSVKYKITNDQDTDTGLWSMRVEMPAVSSVDRVRYINDINLEANTSYNVEARFDGINTTYNPTVKIYTDINNQVTETNENDNILTVNLNSVGYNYNNYYYDNYRTPNLNIISVETGKMINNSFTPQTNFVYGDMISLRVRVRNTGGDFSNTWSTRTNFYDNLGSNKTIVTDNERPIRSGEDAVLIIQTNQTINRGNIYFNINIDSNNTVYESNENDNYSNISTYIY